MPPLSIHNNCCDHLPVKTKLCNLVQCSVPGLQSQEYTPPVWSLSFDTQRVRRKASCLQVIAWSLVQDISSFSLPPHVPFSLHPITYPPSISTPSLILLSPPPHISFSLHPSFPLSHHTTYIPVSQKCTSHALCHTVKCLIVRGGIINLCSACKLAYKCATLYQSSL